MRVFAIILLFTLPITVSAQYNGLLSGNFFGRQPSARAESMGKAYTSVDGDLGAVYFNPAGISSLKGIALYGAYTPPSFYATEGYYTYFGAGYHVNKYLQIALSQFHFDYGKTNFVGVKEIPFSERNTLTVASEPIKDLYLGLNANYLVFETGIIGKKRSFYLDFGAIKRFTFLQGETCKQSVNLAASISNFTLSTMAFGEEGSRVHSELPITARFGVNYKFTYNTDFGIADLETLQFLVQGEYQNVLNSDYYSAYRAGGEIVISEILALRGGYYIETVNDNGMPSVNYGEISTLTFGFGLQLPLNKLTNLPLNIQFDYVSLPQQAYSRSFTEFDNFTTYSLSLNWLLKETDSSQGN